ncbi:zinc ribbon domain-containing protein [Streptomyces mirabilis]|uniref:zinc ribbon domain-containing protein n=1 Tax=Streptomyces mirabilis TaxID=68239 RepID=UPI0033E35249
MLEYKAVKHGRTFAEVDQALPSSQVCLACGLRHGPSPARPCPAVRAVRNGT